MLFSLRLNLYDFPVAYLINDFPQVEVDIELDKQYSQYANKYEVKHSPASREVKEFTYAFDNELQQLYFISLRGDSIQRNNPQDTMLALLQEEWKSTAGRIKEKALAYFNKANNPSLLLFELGYFEGINKKYFLESLSPEEQSEILSKATMKFPDHKGLAIIKNDRNNQIAQEKSRNATQAQWPGKPTELWTGKPAPDFSLPDVSGKEVKLSSFKGKYVLVDFWASWCKPCRDENPNVVNAFNKYRNKNFTVLGVSLDRPGQKDEWIKAIRADNLTWTQVSDLKFWESSVVPLYGFNGIPYNVLVDPQGIVIGENLRENQLDAKLNEVLK
jgi:peroxiredoxin